MRWTILPWRGDTKEQVVTTHRVIGYESVYRYLVSPVGDVRRGFALTAALEVPGYEVQVIKKLQSACLCFLEKTSPRGLLLPYPHAMWWALK